MGGGVDRHRLAHGGARHARRVDGAEHDPGGSRRLGRAARVDGQRLQPQLRGAADHRRRARRPLRPPQALRRSGSVCSPSPRRPARSRPTRLADRGARRPGRRRRAADAARPGAAERRVPAPEARHGDRAVQRGHRTGGGQRPARRRRDRRGHRLGVDLLDQRPDRAARDPVGADEARESRGPDAGLDVPGLALATAGAFGIVWGLVRGNVAGWDSVEVLASLALGARWSSASSPGSGAPASR